MLRFRACLILLLGNAYGQNCTKYGASTTLTGTLVLIDEAGYNQFVAFRPTSPVCTVADPKDLRYAADPYYRMQTTIREFDTIASGEDSTVDALRDRVNRLAGHSVIVKGELNPATTGYERTNVVLHIHAIEPADPAGRAALLAPKVEPKIKEVTAYEVTIKAGKRLVIEAFESNSRIPLLPPGAYLPHWMTGAEVIYANCRDGYERTLLGTTQKEGENCFDFGCAFSAFPKIPLVIRLKCTKTP